MSKFERVLRVVIGILVIVGVWYFYASWWVLIGLVPLITGLIGFCPIYRVLGKQSCPFKKK
ncbi:YgaP family membrane protein [Campylobacter lanienae]|uniref:YgaP family membrane protein n=1 Tax=Campylobacter lanienae TaxID=75658 RepID=UPI000BB43D3F|nr:DUF2892 domain-containing protein [Campylobacter lanienae]